MCSPPRARFYCNRKDSKSISDGLRCGRWGKQEIDNSLAQLGKILQIALTPREFEESNMTKIIHGKVCGRTIELSEDLGLAEGQEVEVSVRPLSEAQLRKPGEGLIRTEGALANDPYWDAIMEEIYQERKNDTRKET